MNKISLLMVDDDNIFLQSMKAYLSIIEEIDITAMNNPIEALDYIKQNKVDIIFVDFFMPELTGEEFVKSLREFNKDVLVILQTGYADKKSPVETLQSMNIQGYFDKTNPPEELEMMVRATIKTHNLIQMMKQKEMEITMLSYKNEIMGNLISGITNNLKTCMMTISMAQGMIKDKSAQDQYNKYEEELSIIEDSIKKESKMLNALNFYTDQKESLEDIFEVVSTLSKVKLLIDKSNLNVNIQDNISIKCKSNMLILILLELVTYLSDKVELIEIDAKNEIIVLNKFDYENQFIEKVQNIAKEDGNITIEYNQEDKILKIIL